MWWKNYLLFGWNGSRLTIYQKRTRYDLCFVIEAEHLSHCMKKMHCITDQKLSITTHNEPCLDVWKQIYSAVVPFGIFQQSLQAQETAIWEATDGSRYNQEVSHRKMTVGTLATDTLSARNLMTAFCWRNISKQLEQNNMTAKILAAETLAFSFSPIASLRQDSLHFSNMLVSKTHHGF